MAAQSNENFLAVILEANILGLLRPFLQQVLWDTRRIAQHSGDRLLVYDAGDFELLEMIRKDGLRGLSPPIFSDNASFVDLRWTILARAFDVVLRRGDSIGEADMFAVEIQG